MDENTLWRRIQEALRNQPPNGENEDEYLLKTKFGQRRTNRIRVFEDHLERCSDGPKSKWRKIRKEDVLWYADLAMNADDDGRCIKDLPGEPPRMGSIVCAILDLLPDFMYREGQIITYFGK